MPTHPRQESRRAESAAADGTAVRELLAQPVAQAARVVALRLLETADAQRRRLGEAGDAEALHDFRVALRRLRSWLRAYRTSLRDSVSGKHRRALREVARATNAGRDAEVHVEWLRGRAEFFSRRRRHGTEWLIGRLEARGLAATKALGDEVGRSFVPLRRKLARRLESYARRVDEVSTEVTFAAATAMLVREHAEALREKIASVRGPGDQEAAHEARIAAKHLRYLMEPVASEAPGAEALLSRLEGLQDVLGALHDAHVFGDEVAAAVAASASDHARQPSRRLVPRLRSLWRAEADPAKPGLQAVAQTLHQGMAASFASFARDWTGEAAGSFWAGVADVAAGLHARAGGSGPSERRYLLSGLPRPARRARAVEIVQGYLPGVRLVEHLRRVTDDGVTSFYRAVGVGRGAARTEVEEETTRDVFDRLWPLTRGRRLAKRRRRVLDGTLSWEIDEFTDRGLVLAEVDPPANGTAIEIPEWLRPFVVREVTSQEDYENARLAR